MMMMMMIAVLVSCYRKSTTYHSIGDALGPFVNNLARDADRLVLEHRAKSATRD